MEESFLYADGCGERCSDGRNMGRLMRKCKLVSFINL